MAHPSHLLDRPPSRDQEVDPEKKAKRGWQSALIGHPLLIAVILLHILLAILAAWFIVDRQVLAKRLKFEEVSVTVTGPSAAAAKQQTKVTEKREAISVPDVTNSITIPETTSVNLPDVALPEVSNNASDGKLNGTGLSGEGLAMGNGSGPGTGMMAGPDTAINAADIMPTPFGGTAGLGDGFEGKFYDLKQLRDRSNSGVGVGEYPKVVKDFMDKNWPANYFLKYYAGHQKLYLSQVLIPYMLAENGPKAFNVEKDVKPGCWVALYHAKVRVSQTITFRFCGFGDDVDEVAVNSKTVFDGSYRGTAISQTIAFPVGGRRQGYGAAERGRSQSRWWGEQRGAALHLWKLGHFQSGHRLQYSNLGGRAPGRSSLCLVDGPGKG